MRGSAPATTASARTGTCPVTIANRSTPPGEMPSVDHHEDGSLWTILPRHGVLDLSFGTLRRDGSIAAKFPWWADVEPPATTESMGLAIEGRRLDGRAGPLRASIPDGYGPGFQASALIFPSEGCWEVTGSTASTALTFVVIVVAR